jgi:hypothetical protein
MKVKDKIGLGRNNTPKIVSATRSEKFAKEWCGSNNCKTFGSTWLKQVILEIEQCSGAAIENIDTEPRGSNQQEVLVQPHRFEIVSPLGQMEEDYTITPRGSYDQRRHQFWRLQVREENCSTSGR